MSASTRRDDATVSVVLMTYNHEPYVAQALDGVFEQELEGCFEVIVTEDCSTDRTREIVHEYAAGHAEMRLLLSPRNLNSNEVLRRGLESARGRYVALLDGDDYWTSPLKLATQVERLEAEPELSACFHNVEVVYEDGRPPHPFHLERPNRALSARVPEPIVALTDLVRGNFIQTCSVVFRRESLPPLPRWYDGLALGDWPLYLLLAERGPLAYIDEVLAAYRVHGGGQWSARLSRFERVEDIEDVVRVYEVLDGHLAFRYADRVAEGIRAFCAYAAEQIESQGRSDDAELVRRLANRGRARPADRPPP